MPVIDHNLLSHLSLLAYAAPEQGDKPEGWGGAGQAAGLTREARSYIVSIVSISHRH